MGISETVYRVGSYEVKVERKDEQPNFVFFEVAPVLCLWYEKRETWVVDITCDWRKCFSWIRFWGTQTHWAASIEEALKKACAYADRLARVSQKSRNAIEERVVEPMLRKKAIQELLAET